MSTDECIIRLFCEVDEIFADQPKHPQAKPYPSEVVTLAVLFGLKGGGKQAFYRWISRNYRSWFRTLFERTRLFRLFAAYAD